MSTGARFYHRQPAAFRAWSTKQHITFRRIVGDAWKADATRFGLRVSDTKTKEAWYRGKLRAEFNVDSSKQIDANHYAQACSLFERIAGNSFYWTLRALGGTAAEQKRKLLFLIAGQVERGDLAHDYAQGVAMQALKLDSRPLLELLTNEQLVTVLEALKAVNSRLDDRAAETFEPEPEAAAPASDDIPF